MHPLLKLRLSQCVTSVEALQTRSDHWDDLDGFTFIISQQRGASSLRLRGKMDFRKGGFLRSPFAHDNLFFCNNELIEKSFHSADRNVQIAADYSVSFDLNVATYLRSWMLGNDNNCVGMLQEVIRALRNGRINWDLMPYLVERPEDVLKGKHRQQILATFRHPLGSQRSTGLRSNEQERFV
jgi:hypothetical protein